jgi:hypothetical protein
LRYVRFGGALKIGIHLKSMSAILDWEFPDRDQASIINCRKNQKIKTGYNGRPPGKQELP